MKTQKNTSPSGKRHSCRFILAALAAATSAALPAAVPEISGVTMTQASDRLVTITYTLADAPAVVTVDVQTPQTTPSRERPDSPKKMSSKQRRRKRPRRKNAPPEKQRTRKLPRTVLSAASPTRAR